MKKTAIIAIAILVLAVVAVFFITKEPKDENILAALDKTNYNTKDSSTGITSVLTGLLPFLA